MQPPFPKPLPFLLAISLLLACVFKSAAQDSLYNRNCAIACHNCYEKKFSKSIADALSYTSTIEIDIWDLPLLMFNRSGFLDDDWYVKHSPLQKGNKNSFGGSFAQCLSEIANWSNENPNHPVLTVFIDKKQYWGGRYSSRSPQDLDNLIRSVVGRDKIFTPKDFSGRDDPRSAVEKNEWKLASLKGKIIFILTDASLFKTRNKVLNTYLNKDSDSSVCFVAPIIKSRQEVVKPKGIASYNTGNIVFYNLDYKHVDLSSDISSRNYISRIFRLPETSDKVDELEKKKINFIALYNYKMRGKLNASL